MKNADILISAIGKPEFVQGSWIKPGAVVIDVGTNSIPGTLRSPSLGIFGSHCFPAPTKKSGQCLVGDVDYASASRVAPHITPVPGGVAPMTLAPLMSNTLMSAERR